MQPKDFLTDDEMNNMAGGDQQTSPQSGSVAPPAFIPDEKADTFFSANEPTPAPTETAPKASKFNQFAQGVAKGELETVKGLSGFGASVLNATSKSAEKLAKALGGKGTPAIRAENIIPESMTPALEAKTPYESFGKGTETVAEYALGGLEKAGVGIAKTTGKVLTDKLLAPLTKKILTKGAEYATDFATAFGQAKLHGADNKEATIAGASVPVVNTGLKLVGKGLGAIAKKVGTTISDQVSAKTPEFYDSKILQSVGDTWNKVFPTSVSTLKGAANKGDTALEGLHNSAAKVVSNIVENKNILGLVDDAGNARLPQNRAEMYDATKVMKQNVYKAYTDILKKTDPKPFIDGVQADFRNLLHKLNNKLVTENSLDGQNAISNLIREIRDAPDLSPTGLQNYVERLNARSQSVFTGGSPAAMANESAYVSSEVRDIISKNIENLKGDEYKQLRSLYGAYKTIEKDAERAARSYINKTGNKLFEGASNIISGADTLVGLATHDPMSIIRGMAIKGAEKANAYLKSPERNLKKMFDEVENIYNVASKKGEYGTPSTRINKPESVIRKEVPKEPLQLPSAKSSVRSEVRNQSVIPLQKTSESSRDTEMVKKLGKDYEQVSEDTKSLWKMGQEHSPAEQFSSPNFGEKDKKAINDFLTSQPDATALASKEKLSSMIEQQKAIIDHLESSGVKDQIDNLTKYEGRRGEFKGELNLNNGQGKFGKSGDTILREVFNDTNNRYTSEELAQKYYDLKTSYKNAKETLDYLNNQDKSLDVRGGKVFGAGGVALATGASAMGSEKASADEGPSVKDKINSFLGKETYTREKTPEEELSSIQAIAKRALKTGAVKDVPGEMSKPVPEQSKEVPQQSQQKSMHIPEKGILEGVDITKWATDPNHERNSAKIYKLMPSVATSSEIDQYIKSKAPNSKINGQMVLKAAKDYNVPIKVVLTIAQQDSMFATKGLGKRTNNPMNWGNDDTGRIAKFKRVEDGLRRGVEQLSKFKVN